jgi:Tol biopolymer transport system component
MFTANADGKDLYLLDQGDTSHFWWRDAQTILAWAWHPSHGSKFYLFEDCTDKVHVVGPDVMTEDGHCSYLPDKRWILNDTYPDTQRNQNPYLYNVKNGRRHPLGHFYSPKEYAGDWRCDNHPRFSPDGTKVVIDSPHGGSGRQLYLIDVSQIVKGES